MRGTKGLCGRPGDCPAVRAQQYAFGALPQYLPCDGKGDVRSNRGAFLCKKRDIPGKFASAGIPEEFLCRESVVSQLHTRDWCRMLIYIRTKSESSQAFACTQELEEIVKAFYPENSWLVGETPSTRDIRDTITEDNNAGKCAVAAGRISCGDGELPLAAGAGAGDYPH